MPYDSQAPATLSTAYNHVAEPPYALAPWWHTVAIIALLLAWATISRTRIEADLAITRFTTYISSLMMGWMLFGAVVAGIYQRQSFFTNTLQRGSRPWFIEAARALQIFVVYIAAVLIVNFLLHAIHLHTTIDRSIVDAMAPSSIMQLLLWAAVSITAGFCEEHVFRGYLLPQAIAWCRIQGASSPISITLGIITTSALFGSLHLYEGIRGAILIGLLGAVYSCFALHYRNLRAIILAHAAQDFFVGLVLFVRHAHST